METKFKDVVSAYGKGNVKHKGNTVIAYNGYGMMYGWTVKGYKDYEPDTLVDRVYTSIENTGRDWDKAYDLLFGEPTMPDFKGVLA